MASLDVAAAGRHEQARRARRQIGVERFHRRGQQPARSRTRAAAGLVRYDVVLLDTAAHHAR